MATASMGDLLRRTQTWRVIGWSAAAALVALPWLAMQISDEVNWTASDFVFAAGLLGGAGLLLELAASKRASVHYRLGVAVALAASVGLMWINGAVGVIGTEDNPANLMYRAVLAVALAGSIMAGFRPRGMARAMTAAAGVVVLVGLIAVATGAGAGGPRWPLDVIGLTAGFAALWLGSAWLFRRAAA